MKAAIFLFLLTTSAFAANSFALVTINWNDRFLSEGLPLQCDDSYYSGVDIEMPGTFKDQFGEVKPSSMMTFKDCGADWKIIKQERFMKNGQPFMRVRMKGASSCEIEIQSFPSSLKKTFSLTIGDAC
jgi:hypothetical protein